MKSLLFLVLILWAGMASANDVFIDVNGFSKHSQGSYITDCATTTTPKSKSHGKGHGKGHGGTTSTSCGSEKFNSQNGGLGLTYSMTKHFDAKVGFYDNSYYRTSWYAGVNAKYDFNYGKFSISPGVMVGGATGYDNTPMYGDVVQLIAIPNVKMAYGPIGMTLGYIPKSPVGTNKDEVQVSVVTLQFNVKVH
jgi:hypothetical protein